MNNRKHFVSINGFESSKLNITCGVPQGSTLGSLLFLIYLNDLRFCLNKSSSNCFADDTCLIYASKKVKTLETDLNTDPKATSEWLKGRQSPKFALFFNLRNRISIKNLNQQKNTSKNIKF